MRLISKGKEPAKLAEYRNKGERYDNGMDAEYREPVVAQLLNEQSNRCAYCGASLKRQKTKIEHWATRTLHPERDLEYSNLLAVCYGDLFCGTNLHCDRSREEKTDLVLNPLNANHIDQLYFKKDGTLNADDPELYFDLNSPKRLNLNCENIVRLRRNLLSDFRNQLRNLQKRGKTIRFCHLLQKERASENGFNDIIIEYLERKA